MAAEAQSAYLAVMTFARCFAILALLASTAVRADAPRPEPLPLPPPAASAPQPVPRPLEIPSLPAPAPIADAPKGAAPNLPTVQGYGARNPDCAEWTDACHICKIDDKGAAQCSTPGVACTPSDIVCKTRKPLMPPADAPKPETPKSGTPKP